VLAVEYILLSVCHLTNQNICLHKHFAQNFTFVRTWFRTLRLFTCYVTKM